MQASWPSPRGCSGLWFICWGLGTGPRLQPSSCKCCFVACGSAGPPETPWEGIQRHGHPQLPRCPACQCVPCFEPTPPVTYSAVDFLSSGILQCLEPHLDASPREICWGKATVVDLASQDQGEVWGWVSPHARHRYPPVLGSG